MDVETLGPAALREMHDRDRDRGIDPSAIPRSRDPAPPPAAPPFRFPEWDGSSVVEPVRAVDPQPAEDQESRPARPQPKSATPNLAQVQEWQAGQLIADTGGAAS